MEKMKDIRGKNDFDLKKMLAEKRGALSRFRFGLSGSKSRDVKVAKNARRAIARVLTELNQRNSK
ncbi:MAG: 50S ribosomal protein L29 [Candidatus Paceibacterota bacterium]